MTVKFHNIAIRDLDGDLDLDVVTTGENAGPGSRGLGDIWYENPPGLAEGSLHAGAIFRSVPDVTFTEPGVPA